MLSQIELQPMKFSSTLQFNAVPEWREHYIDYDHLKDLIFKLERQNIHSSASSPNTASPESQFTKQLLKEVNKINSFFEQLVNQIFVENAGLVQKLDIYLQTSTYTDNNVEEQFHVSDSSDDEQTTHTRRTSTVHQELANRKSLPFENVSLRKELLNNYVQLNELLSFIDLNREGVRKALKKFDKVTGKSLLNVEMPKLKKVYVFNKQTSSEIGLRCDLLVTKFAILTEEDEEDALKKMQGMLREHIVYERNTVWRDLISLERQQQGVQQEQSKESINFFRRVRLCGVNLKVPQKGLPLLVALLLFLLILYIQPIKPKVQSRCLSVVVFASLLWSTEALPLFVTSLLVPLLMVVLRVPVVDGEVLSAPDAAAFVFQKMWSPVITVLLGGFSLAAALSKYNLAKALAQRILRMGGASSPQLVVLTLMLVAAFLCMWISNVAAPVLLFGVAQPLLRLLPTSDPLVKTIILGIALASNVGGMASPIASPQNVLALQNMEPVPSWLQWFAISLPVCVLSILGIWLWLCLTTPISSNAREVIKHYISTSSPQAAHMEFRFVHYFILTTTGVTILLWCFSHQLEPVAGDMGVLGLVPLVLLFGTNVLNAADFNNFLWTIVALAMGGIVLGKSVESCGLLATVAESIQQRVSHLPLFAITLIFGFMILVVASFISHTVAALIILPLVKSIGEHLSDDPHPRLIVMISALLCSAAMALPTSGFPNVTAVCMVDELGKPYLNAKDFMLRGVASSFIVYLVVVFVGYVLCRLVGF